MSIKKYYNFNLDETFYRFKCHFEISQEIVFLLGELNKM